MEKIGILTIISLLCHLTFNLTHLHMIFDIWRFTLLPLTHSTRAIMGLGTEE